MRWRNHISRQISLEPRAEQLPWPENRVQPDFDQRDSFGIPRPRVTFRTDDYTRLGLERSKAVVNRIYTALGATDIHFAEPTSDPGHILGTHRCGSNPKTSVTNEQLRCHDHPNLYLLSGGAFPTSATGPPTLTIAALALRAAAAIGQQLSGTEPPP